MPPITLREKLDESYDSIKDLFTGKMELQEFLTAFTAVSSLVHEYSPDATYDENMDMMTEATRWADDRFGIYQAMDDMVDFRKFLGGLVGGVVEKYDEKLVIILVHELILKGIVAGMTRGNK